MIDTGQLSGDWAAWNGWPPYELGYLYGVYEMTAEFYDLLHASAYRDRAVRLLDRWLGAPVVGVLDVGAGTGLATQELARRTRVTVHAVEPAAGMRAVLLSRLAGQVDLLARVRVHAVPAGRLGLRDAADFAWCINTMGSLDPGERAAALDALADTLVPGGRLLVERPPTDVPARREFGSWNLGGDTYGGEVSATQIDASALEWRFTYRVSRSGALIREVSETFPGWLADPATFDDELVRAGFEPVGTDDPDVVVATRVCRPECR